jgi:hypothetical protein
MVEMRMRKLHETTARPSLEKDITCTVALTDSKDLEDIRSFCYSLPPVDGTGASDLHARRCDFLAEYGTVDVTPVFPVRSPIVLVCLCPYGVPFTETFQFQLAKSMLVAGEYSIFNPAHATDLNV